MHMMRRPNGFMHFNLGMKYALQNITVVGGPFDNAPSAETAFLVCVREEGAKDLDKDVWLKIKDFRIPTDTDAVYAALLETFQAAFEGQPIYVGCMGGTGRTGLFLALICKCLGIEKPINYVREHYAPGAVETEEQEAYIFDFDHTVITKQLQRLAWLGLWHRVKTSWAA